MKVVVIGSGSKGNSTYVETPQSKILIDAGISNLQIKLRLSNQHINYDFIDAIFISHEHSDHISNLVSILKKTRATLYIEENTFYEANRKLKGELNSFPKVFIKANTKYVINDLVVVPIELSHDTKYCMGFLTKELNTRENCTFASITDTGYVPSKYYKILSTIRVLLIESNHDVEMLTTSGRPWQLIDRILSDHGHMSNKQCCDCLHQIVSKYTEKVILGHISEECNDYDLVRSFCEKEFDNKLPFKLEIAYQYHETDIVMMEEEACA